MQTLAEKRAYLEAFSSSPEEGWSSALFWQHFADRVHFTPSSSSKGYMSAFLHKKYTSCIINTVYRICLCVIETNPSMGEMTGCL